MIKIKNKVLLFRLMLQQIVRKFFFLLKQNIFAIFVILVAVSILLFPIKLSEYFKFIDKKYISDILVVIIGSLSSILGIVVAIQLVAFEIQRKTFVSLAFKEFFNSNYSRDLFNSYLITIGVTSLSLISLKENPTNQNYLIIYFSIILFFYCLLILYPSTKRIIRSSHIKDKIVDVISRIDQRTIEELSYFRPRVKTKNHIEIIEHNPIFILNDVCIRSIIEEDRFIPRFIIIKVNQKLLLMLEQSDKGQNARKLINAFFSIYKNTFEKALLTQQNGTIMMILRAIEELNNYCTINKFKYYSFYEMDNEIENMAIKLVVLKDPEMISYMIWQLYRMFFDNLKNNLAPEEDIRFFNMDKIHEQKKDDIDNANQWHYIGTRYFRIYDELIKHAFELENTEILMEIMQNIMQLASDITNSKIGDKIIANIVGECFYFVSKNVIKCSENKYLQKTSFLIPFNSGLLEEIVNVRKEYSKQALRRVGHTFIEIAKQEDLPLFQLNELGSTGRICIGNIDQSEFYKESIIYLINLFVKLYEVVLSHQQINKNNLLLEIYEQAKSIRRFFKSDENKHQDFLKTIENKIESIKISDVTQLEEKKEYNWTEI
ncbi:MAG: hypothetical protein M0Q21_11995 [Ignavibacteriaceae bacterium]|nr:hypothetical protein [Ignavibacteriaceae bacterium]